MYGESNLAVSQNELSVLTRVKRYGFAKKGIDKRSCWMFSNHDQSGILFLIQFKLRNEASTSAPIWRGAGAEAIYTTN